MRTQFLIVLTLVFSNSISCQSAQDYYNAAIELRLDGDYEDALKSIILSLEKEPNEEAAYLEKGLILTSLNKYEEALTFYEEAILRFPHTTQLRIEKGILLSNIGQAELAINCFEETQKYTSVDSVLFNLQNNIAVEKWKIRRFEDALIDFQGHYFYLHKKLNYEKALLYFLSPAMSIDYI